jgi:hypothetical protein
VTEENVVEKANELLKNKTLEMEIEPNEKFLKTYASHVGEKTLEIEIEPSDK